VDFLSVYDAVMEVVVPLMGRRKRDGSTAGVDGRVILPSEGVNIGASFTNSLLYHDKPVKHIFMKKKQVAVECPEGYQHSFILTRSLFDTIVSGPSGNPCCSSSAHKLFLKSSVWMEKVGD
jgi:hypothetical protein